MRSLSGTSPSVTPTSLSSSSAELFSIQSPQVQEEFLKAPPPLRSPPSAQLPPSLLPPPGDPPLGSQTMYQVTSRYPDSDYRHRPLLVGLSLKSLVLPHLLGGPHPVSLSLSSPELLSELKTARTQPLRHVPQRKGLTTVFSGRGRQVSGSSPEA
ncbi:hypothetical protein XENORESO_011110 [Xenotaenia resolanae]|uniref:Uncharacterized protein n=1 Tax=Xenotaenia resolanae TaxID=208358 RepID=A0ABV0W2Y1_9TELE